MIRQKAQGRKNNETDVLLVIKGKTRHRIEDFSSKPHQKELLFDKGVKVKFDGIEEANGRVTFYLTEA